MSSSTTRSRTAPTSRPAPTADGSLSLNHGFSWRPLHTIVEGRTTHVDGRLTPPSGTHGLAVDVACSGDPDVAPEHAQLAEQHWTTGSVYLCRPAAGAPTLVVPTEALTTALVHDAVLRFHP